MEVDRKASGWKNVREEWWRGSFVLVPVRAFVKCVCTTQCFSVISSPQNIECIHVYRFGKSSILCI